MDIDFKNKISTLPLTSGVYLMKDKDGAIIYVGKAVSLRKRVQSYFRGQTHNAKLRGTRSGVPSVPRSGTGGGIKTGLLVAHIADIDFILTHSEAEALILEASLIKEHQPKYNIELKDGKSYPYIRITGCHPESRCFSRDEGSPRLPAGDSSSRKDIGTRNDARGDKFPLVSVVRIARLEDKDPSCRYFGPYVEAGLVREALTLIRKIFPFRTCAPFADKACLYHDLGLCDAPCEDKVSVEDYRRNIRNIALILDGSRDELYRQLKKDMEAFSKEKRFEEAARARDRLRAVSALYSSSGDVNCFKEAEQLERLLSLSRRPERIECIDISMIMGQHSVGSLVSFLNGKPDKSQYRRFRIKEVEGIDDFKMVAEVVRRRYGRLKREGAPFPDLIVIDGGKGQLASACAELKKLEVDIPVISLAKREEEVFAPGKRSPVVLSRDSLALKLLQRLRDEAHRFAVAYHRLLRGKKVFE